MTAREQDSRAGTGTILSGDDPGARPAPTTGGGGERMRGDARPGRAPLRAVVTLAVLLVAVAPVGVATFRGAKISLDHAGPHARHQGARDERRWRCVGREIDAALPAGSRVTVPMDQPLLPYQRAMELVAPHARVVARAADADVELRLVRAPRHGPCWDFRVVVRRLR